MVEKIYIWLVEPLNKRSNETIYEYSTNIDLDATIEPAICADGKKHNLWECSIEAINFLCSSRQDLNLKFEIWGKQGYHGKIRKKTFLFKPKWKHLKNRKKKTAR